MRYALIYVAVVIIGWFVPIAITGQSALNSTAVTAVTITALLASLLVKFAAFDRAERWNQWVVLYVPIMLLAFLMGVAIKDKDTLSCIQLGIGSLIHVAFWLSSCESDSLRLSEFRASNGAGMPHTNDLLFSLFLNEHRGAASNIVKSLGKGFPVKLKEIAALLPNLSEEFIGEVRKEIEIYQRRKHGKILQ